MLRRDEERSCQDIVDFCSVFSEFVCMRDFRETVCKVFWVVVVVASSFVIVPLSHHYLGNEKCLTVLRRGECL